MDFHGFLRFFIVFQLFFMDFRGLGGSRFTGGSHRLGAPITDSARMLGARFPEARILEAQRLEATRLAGQGLEAWL